MKKPVEINDLTALLLTWESLKKTPVLELIAVMQDRINALEKRLDSLENSDDM